jgi:2-polyprenyl-6-hydroxyphenyl methylase / 3-demethylubiquinone-9 3-methyltransferase
MAMITIPARWPSTPLTRFRSIQASPQNRYKIENGRQKLLESSKFRSGRCFSSFAPSRSTFYPTETANARPTSSVSDLEISKFSKLSKTWWDQKHNPLVAMNPIRVKYIVNHVLAQKKNQRLLPSSKSGTAADRDYHQAHVLPPLTGLRALDIGCGGGLLAESLARLGATVTAIDPSTELVETAKLHAKLHPLTRAIDYRGGWTVEQLASEPDHLLGASFDIICLSEVIEHVTDVDAILASVASLLTPLDGVLFMSTLNRTVKSQIMAIIGAEYVMRYVPAGTHDWSQFRSPGEVQELMKRAGLTQVDVCGMVVAAPPLLLRQQWQWRLTPDDTDVNWIGAYGHDTTRLAAGEEAPTD